MDGQRNRLPLRPPDKIGGPRAVYLFASALAGCHNLNLSGMKFLDSRNRQISIRSRRWVLGMNSALFLLTAAWALVAYFRQAEFEWKFLGLLSVVYALLTVVSGYRLSAALRSNNVELFKTPGA
jgi:hypothetical protein